MPGDSATARIRGPSPSASDGGFSFASERSGGRAAAWPELEIDDDARLSAEGSVGEGKDTPSSEGLRLLEAVRDVRGVAESVGREVIDLGDANVRRDAKHDALSSRVGVLCANVESITERQARFATELEAAIGQRSLRSDFAETPLAEGEIASKIARLEAAVRELTQSQDAISNELRQTLRDRLAAEKKAREGEHCEIEERFKRQKNSLDERFRQQKSSLEVLEMRVSPLENRVRQCEQVIADGCVGALQCDIAALERRLGNDLADLAERLTSMERYTKTDPVQEGKAREELDQARVVCEADLPQKKAREGFKVFAGAPLGEKSLAAAPPLLPPPLVVTSPETDNTATWPAVLASSESAPDWVAAAPEAARRAESPDVALGLADSPRLSAPPSVSRQTFDKESLGLAVAPSTSRQSFDQAPLTQHHRTCQELLEHARVNLERALQARDGARWRRSSGSVSSFAGATASPSPRAVAGFGEELADESSASREFLSAAGLQFCRWGPRCGGGNVADSDATAWPQRTTFASETRTESRRTSSTGAALCAAAAAAFAATEPTTPADAVKAATMPAGFALGGLPSVPPPQEALSRSPARGWMQANGSIE